MAYRVAYDLDWRDAFASLGAVDLDSPGASLTFDGVTWRTPAIADGNPVDQVPSTSWGLTATGLRCIEPVNSVLTASNNSAPHLYATLLAISQNSSTPFEADPTVSYIFQCYAPSVTLTPVNNEGVFMAIYKTDFGVAVGNAVVAFSALGQRSGGAGPFNYARAGTGSSPASVNRTNTALDVPTVHWGSSQRVMFYAAPWGGADWAENADLRFVGGYYRSGADMQNDVVCDPPTFRVACGHTSQTLASSYDGTIERIRILQEVLSS